jgi:diguanylate cyclase (GGDEF)-like protein
MIGLIFIIIVGIYVGIVFLVTQAIVRKSIFQADQEALNVQKSYEQLLLEKAQVEDAMERLEEEAAKIFTLYTMTHDITKHFNEEEAFEVFKTHLGKNVSFADCGLYDPLSEEVPAFRDSPDHLLIELKGERRLLGFLVCKGVVPQEKEKVFILGNQFALALRRLRLYQQIEHLAITDSLTDVYTRRYIMNRFEEEVSRSRIRKIQLSFLMIDVDYFKKINDQCGHLTGDQILREVAGLIKEHVRGIDIVGRYGGEEFCVVLPDTDRGGAQYVAERIRAAIEKTTLKAYDNVVNATVSIGSATFPQDGESLAELVDKADWALYRAKKLGRNRICAFGQYDNDK